MVAISFILLTVAFRSVVIATKAAILNLLSIGAAYGVIVAIFQWGWGAGLIGLPTTLPIPAYVPMLVFCIVFGLSMDYEVFLLSRIHEAWIRTRDPHRAVAIGIGSTARVITTAAAIMVVVFASFVLNTEPTVKMLALGMAFAVLIDASLVRMVLVPSIMSLLGRHAWYMPRWLEPVVPHLHLEGSAAAAAGSARPAACSSPPARPPSRRPAPPPTPSPTCRARRAGPATPAPASPSPPPAQTRGQPGPAASPDPQVAGTRAEQGGVRAGTPRGLLRCLCRGTPAQRGGGYAGCRQRAVCACARQSSVMCKMRYAGCGGGRVLPDRRRSRLVRRIVNLVLALAVSTALLVLLGAGYHVIPALGPALDPAAAPGPRRPTRRCPAPRRCGCPGWPSRPGSRSPARAWPRSARPVTPTSTWPSATCTHASG